MNNNFYPFLPQIPSIPTAPPLDVEKFSYDGVPGFVNYPFNTMSIKPITSISINIDNTTLEIANGHIVATNTIYIDIRGTSLHIWTSNIRPNRVLGSHGSSIVDGYFISDSFGKPTKISKKFEYKMWRVSKMSIDKFSIKLKNSHVVLTDISLNNNLKLDIGSTMTTDPSTFTLNNNFDTLSITNTNCDIDLQDSKTEQLNVSIDGNGVVKNVTTNKLKYRLAGKCQLDCKYLGLKEDIKGELFGIPTVKIDR